MLTFATMSSSHQSKRFDSVLRTKGYWKFLGAVCNTTMNKFMKSSMESYISDLHLKMEVYNVVRDMVDDVENWDSENKLRKAQKNLLSTQKLNELVIAKMKRLQEKNAAMGLELSKLKLKATGTRESFVRDIGAFLSENKQMKKLKDKINDLEAKLQHMSLYGYENESETAKEENPASTSETDLNAAPSEAAPDSTANEVVVAPAGEQQMFLYDLDDEFLLNVYSYLETVDIIHCAQVNRYLLKKIYIQFEIESTLVQAEWGVRPDRKALLEQQQRLQQATATVASTPVDVSGKGPTPSGSGSPLRNATPAPAPENGKAGGAVSAPAMLAQPVVPEVALTKEIIDVLIKKLTPTEMSAIMSLAARLKQQGAQVAALSAEREDIIALKENAESVRDFMIEKLKAAETEIKSLMAGANALRKQAASDQEIIGYLDLQVGELESQRTELGTRCQQLQASLDLQIGSHSHREHTLSTELNEYKLKYEKLDVNFKAQKKVLIKEVKQLRAQVDSLTTERNLQTNQFRLLREALALGGGAGVGAAAGSSAVTK